MDILFHLLLIFFFLSSFLFFLYIFVEFHFRPKNDFGIFILFTLFNVHHAYICDDMNRVHRQCTIAHEHTLFCSNNEIQCHLKLLTEALMLLFFFLFFIFLFSLLSLISLSSHLNSGEFLLIKEGVLSGQSEKQKNRKMLWFQKLDIFVWLDMCLCVCVCLPSMRIPFFSSIEYYAMRFYLRFAEWFYASTCLKFSPTSHVYRAAPHILH